jgi:hypothetical protein
VSIITKKVTGKNNNNNGFPLQFAAHASFRTWRNSINAHLVPSRSAPLSLFPNSGQYFYFKIHSLKYQSFFFSFFKRRDYTLQSIVYKMVPRLARNELDRRKQFRQERFAGASKMNNFVEDSKAEECYLQSFFAPNDPISMSLEYAEP